MGGGGVCGCRPAGERSWLIVFRCGGGGGAKTGVCRSDGAVRARALVDARPTHNVNPRRGESRDLSFYSTRNSSRTVKDIYSLYTQSHNTPSMVCLEKFPPNLLNKIFFSN